MAIYVLRFFSTSRRATTFCPAGGATTASAQRRKSSHCRRALLRPKVVLEEETPVRLRINRTVSSADAHVGDTVDF